MLRFARSVLSGGCLVIGLTASAGCVSVAPWEREHLAKPAMNEVVETDETEFRAHVYDAREGATGGHGSTGGGCGCN